MYNTETASYLGSYWNGLSVRDFRHVREELYRKKTGEYFLYGEGGPMTCYSEPFGDMRGSGEGIHPMTEAEARAWAEDRLEPDEYIDIFGEPEE